MRSLMRLAGFLPTRGIYLLEPLVGNRRPHQGSSRRHAQATQVASRQTAFARNGLLTTPASTLSQIDPSPC